MKNRVFLSMLAAAMACVGMRAGRADMTPLDEAIPEEKPTNITCELAATETSALGSRMALKAGEYHYQVLLPLGYHASGKQEYPCLFITMPGGNATPGAFLERLKKDRWIAVCLTEAKNGDWEPIAGNFIAAHDDATKRFRIANHFKFMTGFSGGARASSVCSVMRPGFAGLLLQGAGFTGPMNMYNTSTLQANPGICVYAEFGIGDGNQKEAIMLNAQLPASTFRRFSLAEGGHQQATEESAEVGMDFLEDCVYARRAPMDQAAVEQYKLRFQVLKERADEEKGLTKLESFEEANRIATAHKLGTDKALTADVAEVVKQVKDLAAAPELAKEIQARATYWKIRDIEDANWVPVSIQPQKVVEFAKQAAPAYEAIAKKYDGTVYGQKAAERAVWLAKGVEKPDKAGAEKP